ncbi:MAG: NADH-quinone oxidoreductase subunit H, partial [Alphaproteobacteria bacterium]|nr:NADH-quinone oxidoreductase subunit H [Alphaproteobacteria bacterium]
MAELMQNPFVAAYILPLLWIVAKILMISVPLMIAMAYLTYAERKILASMQLRQGPM